MLTVTFDPAKTVTVADLARGVGVTHGAALKWVERNLGRAGVPDPLFTLPIGGGARQMHIWNGDDLPALVARYRAGRASRGIGV